MTRGITGPVVLLLFIAAALLQCGRSHVKHTPQDSCGGSNSHPVTIGGSMVVGCQ